MTAPIDDAVASLRAELERAEAHADAVFGAWLNCPHDSDEPCEHSAAYTEAERECDRLSARLVRISGPGGVVTAPTVTVAALYIDPRGPYPRLDGVECYGLPERDARAYDGPHPVVAHPPCAHYGKLRHLATTNDADCAPRAVEQVRAWGGVLEHPAGSLLWRALDLPEPGCLPDAWGGYSVEVCQVDWGHVARKRTWLYLVRVPSSALTWPTPREPTHWISGGRGRAGAKAKTTPVPPGIKVCSAQQRRRTPVDFARYLVGLAAGGAPEGT